MAQMMVSAGYPATALAGYPLAVVASVTVSVPAVTLAPVPLWFVSGATTVTLVCGRALSACTVALIPGAVTPSSFVTRTVSVADGLEAAPAMPAARPEAVRAAKASTAAAAMESVWVRRCIPLPSSWPDDLGTLKTEARNVTRPS